MIKKIIAVLSIIVIASCWVTQKERAHHHLVGPIDSTIVPGKYVRYYFWCEDYGCAFGEVYDKRVDTVR